jgi:hypothetical protein
MTAFVTALLLAWFGYVLPYELSPYRAEYHRLWSIGDPPPDAALLDKLAWVGPLLALSGLVLVTWYAVARWRWRGFLHGVLIALFSIVGTFGLVAGAFYLIWGPPL